MPDVDTLSAALEEIRELVAKRAELMERLSTVGSVPVREMAPVENRIPQLFPSLLAAVDKVLALHSAEPWYLAASDCGHPEPEDDMSDEWQDWDDSHVTGSGGILICRETQIASFCRECTRLNYGDGEPEGDDFVSAPCGTCKAVLAALTGKDKPDGQ